MPSGLQIFNANGKIILDTNDRVGRFLGSFTTNGNQSGSFIDSNLIGKTSFFYYSAQITTGAGEYGGPLVTANLSNGRVSWQYKIALSGSATATPPAGEKIFYGVY